MALSSDEELGCKGVGTPLDAIAEGKSRPSLCVVGEPTLMCVPDRHKGKVSLRVAVRGRSAHSSIPARGVNAVTWAAHLIAELDDLSDELARGPHDETLAVPHAPLSVGPIRGGVSLNVVPDNCTFDVELRYPPGENAERLVGAIRARAQAIATVMQKAAPEAAVDLTEAASYPPLSPSAKGIAAMRSLGVVGSPIAVDFGTEAGYYHKRLGACHLRTR